MKHLLLAFIIVPFIAFSQVADNKPEAEKSKLENFSLKTGSLIKKEYSDVAEVKKVSIQTLVFTDLLLKTNLKGIKLEMSVSKSYGSTTKSCFLDADEIDGFIKSGKLLVQDLAIMQAENYTEYQFTSRDGFQSGAFSNEKKEWRYFIKIDKYDSDSYVFLNKEEFEKMITAIETAKTQL